MTARRCLRAALTVAVALVACAGCVSLPEAGEVRVTEQTTTTGPVEGFPYDPRPPQEGETPVEIVRHFLDAMLATPTSTVVSKQFLTENARAQWRPDRQLITYEDFESPTGDPVGADPDGTDPRGGGPDSAGATDGPGSVPGSDEVVRVSLLNANRLDAGGRWVGALSQEESDLTFAMAVEAGEWRIADLPDATIVSDEFFASRYQQVAFYFLDPTARVLVPEPAFVPRGGQLATALVRGLLQGPGQGLRGVSVSAIPESMELDLSVPVSEDGTAAVSLRGDAGTLNAEQVERIAVQLAWTLRQDPAVRQIRLSINDTPVTLKDSPAEFPVGIGADFDPAGSNAWPDMFGLRDGLLMSVAGDLESRTQGPFGSRDFGLRSVAVNLAGTRAVGVTSDGTALIEASVDGQGDDDARTLVTGATNLLEPSWDHADRVWLVDSTSRGARVSVTDGGQNIEVRVPGVTGQDVSRFMVSRDGSRLVAVVSTAAGDVVRVARLAGAGAVPGVRASAAVDIVGAGDEVREIRDIAWQSPTRILVVQPVADGVSQVISFAVDGSPAIAGPRRAEGVVRQDVVDLIASPVQESPVLGVSADGGIHELGGEDETSVPSRGLRSLDYVG